jgi:hypothetical protein
MKMWGTVLAWGMIGQLVFFVEGISIVQGWFSGALGIRSIPRFPGGKTCVG